MHGRRRRVFTISPLFPLVFCCFRRNPNLLLLLISSGYEGSNVHQCHFGVVARWCSAAAAHALTPQNTTFMIDLLLWSCFLIGGCWCTIGTLINVHASQLPARRNRHASASFCCVLVFVLSILFCVHLHFQGPDYIRYWPIEAEFGGNVIGLALWASLFGAVTFTYNNNQDSSNLKWVFGRGARGEGKQRWEAADCRAG